MEPLTHNFEKLPPAPWFVVYNENTNDYGNGPCGLMITPLEDDAADFFLSSETYNARNGPPEETEQVFDFVALARNALDVMMRRGWFVERFSLLGGGYAWRIPASVANEQMRLSGSRAASFKTWCAITKWLNPFTALVEADRWYQEYVEAQTNGPG